jgi:hypothetical protein
LRNEENTEAGAGRGFTWAISADPKLQEQAEESEQKHQEQTGQ